MVESKSFAQAAREMGMSRSQVNRLVVNLEDALGVSLFVRTTRKISLTPTGQAYYLRVKGILNDLAETEDTLQSAQVAPQGELKINAPMSFGTMHLSPAIAEFMVRYPKIKVHLVLDDRFIDPVSEGFDITIRIAKLLEDTSLIEHDIIEVKRTLVASPKFVADHPQITEVNSLADHSCLHYGNLPSGNIWYLQDEKGTESAVRVNGTLCCNNAEVLRDAAVSGLGIALLPEFVTNPLVAEGQLVRVLPNINARPISLSLLYPPNRHLAARVRVFVKFMQERFEN